MKDPRMVQLARNLVNYSCAVKPGERVLIELVGGGLREFGAELMEQVVAAGGLPFVQLTEPTIQRALMLHCTEEQLKSMAAYELARMQEMQAYIGVRAGDNAYETADVPDEKKQLYAKHYSRPVTDIRVGKTKWVVLRYPLPSMAQQAAMSTEAFEEHYFNVCNLDYAKMSRAMDALVERMQRTDRVRITGRGTDFSFSIKGLPAIKCDGQCNIPDGEVYTAPVRESVNGVLRYNTPSLYNGVTFENVELTFKDGKVVGATANNTESLNRILDTDAGARYVGEFAIGVNPYINEAMKDTLFDEKIAGSFHFTPGCCYDECDNGNKSAIHWDMVCIQTPEYGGGEMYFDDELIRKDGLFVPAYLHCLNPDQLK